LGGGAIKSIVGSNQAALGEVKTFGKLATWGFVVGMTSAVVLGVGLGDDHKDLVYVGIGGLLVSTVLDAIGDSHLKKGVRIFNVGRQ
jgi:hypothetical protein